MIVVSDTSPLNYLILIAADQVLPLLFGKVVAPEAVIQEMTHLKAPAKVKAWAINPPAWLEIHPVDQTIQIEFLGLGETAAIVLAQQLKADVLLMDERNGIAVAKQFGLFTAGTLGILERAAEKKLLKLPEMIDALRQTTFHAPEKLLQEMLQRDKIRNTMED